MTKPELPRTSVSWDAALLFVTLAGGYRLLVGTDAGAEWGAGLIASALASVGAMLIDRQLPPTRAGRTGAARLARQIPRLIVESVQVLGSGLTRQVPAGAFIVIPFDPGGDDAESAGRRAVVIAGLSLAPNRIVVALDREGGALLVHELRGRPGPAAAQAPDREWPP